MGDKEDTADTRIEFMQDYLLKSLKLKAEKWNKFITGDERHVLYRYFDIPKFDIIVFRVNTAGLLTCATQFPPISRGKMCVTVGEISGNVIQDLSVMADEVIGPLLCNPGNQKGWPKIVRNDMKRHVDELRSLFHQLKGEMSSQVMLPMPAGVENIFHAEAKLRESDGEDVDLYLKTNIEGAVIKWTQQVHDLLAEDSYIAFKRTKFPMPSADIDFYATRLKNLEGIYSQLRDPRVKRMAHYLEDTHKCRDIYVYQKPLAIHFETFEGNDFQEAKWLVRPMFHCIGLLWGNSRYYCNVEKLIPLLREVCNLVIMQCTNSIDPPTIFQGDPDEQLLKLRRALAVLKQFIDTYELNRDKVHTFFPAGVTPVRWSFDFDRVFMRFNIYVKKLRMIEEILDATCEIIKLEKVEFCGLRGKIISTECMKVLEEYTLIYQNLGNITYDPADPEDNSFLPDYKKHMGVLADVDRRLASLFTQGLDECNDQPHFIKFFQIMGDLFHRPVIKAELKPKLNRLLDYMHNNLDQTKEIFDEEMAKLTKGPERPMVDPYLPPVAGVIWWVQKLQTESAIYIKQKMNEMNGYINQVEDRNFKPWCGTVPGICKTHLAKNLIYRDPPFVRNNFAPELVMLLREIRYMKYLNKQGIPQDGLDLYARNEKLQYDMNRLNRAISWYNAIREGSHETEAINALQERVLRAQNNMLRGLANIAAWGDIPLHNRKENPDKMELRNKILESHAEFQDILVTNYKLFFNIQEDEQSIDDEEELEDVDEATLDDDEKAARAAKIREIAERREVKRLAREEREAEKAAANQIKFERREARRLIREAKEAERAERQARRDAGEEVDSPAEEEEVITDPDELADIEAEKIEMEEERFRAARWPAYVRYVDSLVSKQIMKAIEVSLNLFEKQTDLEKGPQVAFLRVVAELRDPDIYFSPSLDIDETGGLYDTLREMMKDMFLQATLFPRIDEIKYEKYTPLWMEDRHEVLENFLKYGRVIPPEEFDKYVYENGCEPPTLDLKLLNQAIMNIICKWSNLYKENLKEHVQTSLDVLEKFIIYATKELSVELGDDDYEGLLQVMRVMNEVKAKVDADTDHMFEPLRDIIDVLKEYGLEVLPDRWRNLTRLCTVMKNTIAPLQATQAGLIAKRVALINLRLNMYRDQFKDKEMFLEASKEPYRQIDKVNQELMEFDSIVEALKKSCQLFDIQPPDEKNLKQCRREKSPWKKIDADGMDQECKRLTKDLRQLDKDMRVWEPYIAIEGIIKNLMTSLPDLLALNLHKYEEEVKTIVDKSVKEAAMEKTLKELEATWAVMEFDYSPHDRTGIKLPKASEELVETLEDNQNQVQNMMSSKFIGFFEVEVTAWQKKLGTADAVISLWFEVQRKWQYLESIFVGSDDIRAQLPEDSRRFDNIDKTFKELLKDIGNTPNVVASTNKAGLLDKLEELMKNLNLCEKALNDYLETKRLAYPRFYFVSSADLLDILSNGNNPPAVGRHLTKLYDNLAKLVFPKGSKHAFEMISKENEEHVPFKAPCCDCSGKVELWLNRVTDCMRYTLRDIFEHAVISYEDKPRDEWVFDWPAQPALVSTQIWWTTETNQAFEKLEEGYENALKDYQKKQIQQLNNLIVLLLGDLTVGDRQKIMTICTIDVHSRDVVAKLIVAKVDNSNAFQWQSQLRHRWDYKLNNCFANICDAQFLYDYEYLGNTPRLVITPLTDRCYITLTQSTFDNGWCAGRPGRYRQNRNYEGFGKSAWNHGVRLAQTGAWGCFDEFNRISVEVLSVVSVQVKSVLDAIKFKKKKFEFMGEHIILIPTVGMFITMNPGYAGRTELPENLKALFRPCAMVVPDFELICEIMLVAEGFQEARLLARKFITLYTLCRELLSKQDHYDWGLRAIKSVLVVAGSLKRGDRLRPEDQVLMRALRDFNVPKIVTDDTPVFMGLIGDLFPALDVPRKRDFDFEQKLREAAVTMKLQPEPGFILKMVQLVELFAVRHSVFIDGFAGTGKSAVWQCLNKTYHMMKLKPFYNDLDPKAVTNDELFGIINPATREWRDGLFSTIMRDMANMPGDGPKWIVLDGDIDPMWIESLNTLMDDNKVLTLASNERIALTKPMRLLFEIANLRTATPATTTRDDESEKAMLTVMFDKYIPALLETSKKYKRITPLTDLQQIQLTCYLLECFLNKSLLPSDCPKEWYEIYFVFAVMWGFGSGLFQDQLVDWRNEFSKWFCNEFKQIKFPSTGNVFSFFIDPETKKFLPWSERVEKFDLDPDLPLQSCLVSTSETTRIRFFMDLLITKQKPVMLVGSAGSGKTVSVAAKLNALPDSYAITNAPLNFYTTSEMIQKVLEKPLEKKSGRNFGPPGSKFMIYFVDDLNMPEVDTYGTVQPHTLIREFMDYKHWYDRQKLSLKEISNCMFVSCMNPTAALDACIHIYVQILSQHLANPLNKFLLVVVKYAEVLVNTALALHNRLSSMFLPTAVKFHYIFNLRDLSNIFQEFDEAVVFEKPLIYCHFAEGIGDPKYFPIKDWPQIKRLLDESLSGYNDMVASMNLVLFEDAMYHICRINRILEAPRGNALLVGVGGSGKQSLSRLSAFISSLEVFQIQLRKGYCIVDLKVDLAALYIKAGLKNIGNMFLMTDAQVAEERFLVLINDLLASGEIPELLADDEIENIINGVRGETKASGVPDTRENCWRFFINRVRTMLKVVLCFSPVGATLRVRARKFPSLVNCTAINWFHEWPAEALRSVSKRFISEVEALPPFLVDPVANFMAHVHQSVNQMSAVYFQNEKRYNYTTPKTFLELISLYSKLLSEKTTNLKMMITRLENGLEKLASCAADVAVLKITLAEQEIILKVKNKAAEELIEEEKKVKVIEEDVTIKANICAADLAKAEPALLAAQEALNTLNKNNLTELKAFGSPPDAVVMVTAAVLVLFSKRGKIAKDRSWKACKAVMPYIKNPEFDPTIIASKSGAAAGLCSWVINICKFYDVFVVVEPKRKALAAANAELQAARDKLSFLTDQIKELEEKLGVLMKAFQEAVNEKMKCQAEADATNYTIDLANRLESGITLPGDVLLVSSFISYVGCFMRRYRLQLINDDWVPTLAKTNPKIESTEGLDPLSMLTDDAQVACWNNEGLPTDTMSAENATILTNSARWPLMIDPQLQGIKWIKTKYGDALVVIRLTQRNYIDRIERAVTSGNVVLLENIGETVDAVLDPLLGRVLIRKGKILKIGDREMDYHPSFRLVIQTKLANPHYQPEMQAQCTLINFTVTKDGLEEQLLGEVVKAERPDLEALRAGLTKQQNDFKITLKTLEDDLLKRLANAGADILSDSALVINLETTKKTAADIEIKVEEGKITSVKIDEARERYRQVNKRGAIARAATRASLLYFILNEIYKINPMYQFSLKAYNVVFKDALAKAEQADDLEARVRNLLDSITFCVLQSEGKVDPRELDFLLKYAVAPENSPYPWLSNNGFGGIVALAKMDAFENLDKEIEGATKRY
ncbi:hypothetical protein MSG28_007028 [Choristoneura fumiferana]|uniref:Uncharacterized protein n=1 Tax=Choristoneura fumiferana TaxID=7141 RepID=A0ACC0JM27_CHOFU|nr:hypothetical protein MSG28_007028 [Choristoneura fumiferana]